LVTDPGAQSPVSVSVDPGGNPYVLVRDDRDSSLKVYKLDATGNTLWSAPAVGNGGAVIAGRDGVIVVSNVPGATTTTEVQRYDATGHPQYPTPIAVGQSGGGEVVATYDGAGGVYIAFYPYAAAGRVLKRVDRNGRIVFTSPDLGPDVALVHDDLGNAISASGGAEITARKWSPTGASLWSSSLASVYGAKSGLRAGPDGKGGAVVAWVDARRGPAAGDIFTQAVDASGHVRWGANGVEVARDTTVFDVAEDGNTGLWIVWRGSDSHARVSRFGLSGAPAFSAVDLGADTGGSALSIARDGGGAFVSVRVRTDGPNAYAAARLDGEGHFAWPDHVKRFGTALWQQPVMARVAAMQPIVFFADTRAGYSDVYFWR
jgi:hypothetical protein